MAAVVQEIQSLDHRLFSFIDAQTTERDRRALLALHVAAATPGFFNYLEIGSYLGGSLQAVMRDPRCQRVMSIDLRPPASPDIRGSSLAYDANTTEHMVELLGQLPGVDMNKLTTFDVSTEMLKPSDLPARPDYCFIDGEHTHDAVLRDACFCAEAIRGEGIIAFHDYLLVGSAISAFVRENWSEISFALAFSAPYGPTTGSGVLALELGGKGLLHHPMIRQADGSRWHAVAWSVVNRSRCAPVPFLAMCAVMPAVDGFILQLRHGWREYLVRQSPVGSRA